jgi:1-deoxy-D-xylulose-5-phosphate reductoisomerase
VVDKKRYPSVDIIDLLPKNDSLFETVIVSANDTLVEMFLIKKILFTDISKILLKILKSQEFNKFRLMKPKNIHEIKKINDYVSLKIRTLCV